VATKQVKLVGKVSIDAAVAEYLGHEVIVRLQTATLQARIEAVADYAKGYCDRVVDPKNDEQVIHAVIVNQNKAWKDMGYETQRDMATALFMPVVNKSLAMGKSQEDATKDGVNAWQYAVTCGKKVLNGSRKNGRNAKPAKSDLDQIREHVAQIMALAGDWQTLDSEVITPLVALYDAMVDADRAKGAPVPEPLTMPVAK
jgi:hypothetical protein